MKPFFDQNYNTRMRFTMLLRCQDDGSGNRPREGPAPEGFYYIESIKVMAESFEKIAYVMGAKDTRVEVKIQYLLVMKRSKKLFGSLFVVVPPVLDSR